MSIEVILVGIGILLGLVYFIYWAWWSKREKIVVISSDVFAFLETKNSVQKSTAAVSSPEAHILRLSSGCDLVLVKGEHEIKILGVKVEFDEKIYEKLSAYFELGRWNYLQLVTYNSSEKFDDPETLLRPKVPVSFNGKSSFEANSKFDKEFSKLGDSPIESLLKQFNKSNYQLCLLRYDGKELCWRFPDKWWRNLGKKLWG